MSGQVTHRYQLFGLRVSSEVELPEAIPDEKATGDPDIIVRLGALDLPPTKPGISVQRGALLLSVPDVGRYRVSDGRDILIDVDAGVPDKNVRLYLLGSAMGAALHQRGLLPLHANAAEVDGAAVAFIGKSGAGKSTLAGWLHDNGHRVLADDVCVVHAIDRDEPMVFPAVRRLRLWRDALIASGRETDAYDASYSGDPDFDKFDVPLPPDAGSPLRLAAVVLLEFGPADSIQPLEGVEAAEILFEHTYRGAMIDQVGNAELHWQAVTRLIPRIRVLKWTRVRNHAAFREGAQTLLERLRELTAGGPDQTLARQVR